MFNLQQNHTPLKLSSNRNVCIVIKPITPENLDVIAQTTSEISPIPEIALKTLQNISLCSNYAKSKAPTNFDSISEHVPDR